ncbi:MAG: hypothetical protein HQL70_06795 [Magnetococcales bacterium]|nr:hypothetical protein [Magnetococcales bacterium]
MDNGVGEALGKIRNKTCVPSLLWQRLTSTPQGGDIKPLLLREAIYNRLIPHLEILQEQGCFTKVSVAAVDGKPGWVELSIGGITERFFLAVEKMFT